MRVELAVEFGRQYQCRHSDSTRVVIEQGDPKFPISVFVELEPLISALRFQELFSQLLLDRLGEL